MAVYALLIGINDYAGRVTDLRGCHNDVMRVADVLKSRYKAEDSNIKMLLSEEATKAKVVDAFKHHLTKAGEGDTAFVYYSGHGSQETAPPEFWDIEPDKQNETLVCHDSRIGAGDLADKELRFLIANVAKNHTDIIVIFDCCHSGSGTRSAGDVDGAAVRLTGSATETRSIDKYVFYDEAQQQGWMKNLKTMPEGPHIFLSGCRDSELSKELMIEGKRHGVFTHFLCKTLETTTPGSLSYRNLVSRITQQVQGRVQRQHPQVEGIKGANVNKRFMGDEAQEVKFTVTDKNGQWWVDAGAIQGIQLGDQFAIYADADPETSVAEGAVLEVQSSNCRLDITDGEMDIGTPYLANVVFQSKRKLAIEMVGDADGVATAKQVLGDMDGDGEGSRFLQEDPDTTEYRLIAADDRYTITSAIDKRPMFQPINGYSEGSAKKALRQLEHMAKWQHKLELENNSEIKADAVQIVFTYQNQSLLDTELKPDKGLELRYQQQDDGWAKPEFGIELRINPVNVHDKPLYCALMLFDPKTGSVASATENGVWLSANPQMVMDSRTGVTQHARPSFKVFDGDLIEAEVNDKLYQQGISETNDIIKLIVSEKEFNASLLEQEGIEIYDQSRDPIARRSTTRGTGDALESLLDEAIDYSNTRSLARKQKKAKLADWTTKSVLLTTVRPLESSPIKDDAPTELGMGVEIEPHPLTASVSLESQTEATRGLENAGMGNKATPLALQDNDITPPLTLSNTRGVDNGLSVIKIDLPATRDSSSVGAESVTPEQPLVVKIDAKLEEGEQILPFTFDGEFYYPLGYAVADGDKTRIMIEELPESTITPPSDAAEVLAKGLGNSLKLYFQKVFNKAMKLDKDTVRLAIPKFDEEDNTKVVDFNDNMDNVKAQVANTDKVVIFIHGIIGETKSMAGALNIKLDDGRTIAESYGAHLCFDYENLNTPIENTAKLFKQKLEDAGLKKGHGKEVHIVAHSMGGLVSRWMIEREQGNDIVTKLVMLGTPNNGSPWAGVKDKGVGMVKKWAYGSLTLILNGLTTVPIGGVAVSGMMKLIDSIDDTLDQMAEDSDFTQRLFESDDPGIPYYLVAGTTKDLTVNVDEDEGAFKKVFKMALQRSKLGAYDLLSATLFSKENDVAVNVTSMKHINMNRQKPLVSKDVVSDHMSYFVTPVSVNTLAEVLAKA